MNNHTIKVQLSGSGRGGTKGSAVNTLTKNIMSNQKTNSMSSKQLVRGLRTLRTGDLGNLGLFGGKGGSATMAIVQEVVKVANRVADIAISVNEASSGESIKAGNVRKVKSYFMNPTSYAWDATYGVYLQKLQISRQNQSNEYYRQLSGNIITGNQFGKK